MIGYKNLKVNTGRTVSGDLIIWVTEQVKNSGRDYTPAVTAPLTAEQALELGSLLTEAANKVLGRFTTPVGSMAAVQFEPNPAR